MAVGVARRGLWAVAPKPSHVGGLHFAPRLPLDLRGHPLGGRDLLRAQLALVQLRRVPEERRRKQTVNTTHSQFRIGIEKKHGIVGWG